MSSLEAQLSSSELLLDQSQLEESDDALNIHKKRKLDPNEEGIAEESTQVKKCRMRNSVSKHGKNLESISDSESTSTKERKKLDQNQLQLYESLESHNADVEELRKKLENGNLAEPFTFRFWTALHANHGSTAGYLFGFLLLCLLKCEWMMDEATETSEGHSVSKTLVVLFLFFGYSVITLGFELIQFIILWLEIYWPKLCKRIRLNVNYYVPHLGEWKSCRFFYPCLAILWSMLTTLMGSVFWTWFWWNHVCKSYHDKTCRKSPIGKWIIEYRNEACYDGKASSVICEKLVSYSPIMVLTVILVFVANVLLPLINDRLSFHYPLSENFASLNDIMKRLETYQDEEDEKDEDYGYIKTQEFSEEEDASNDEKETKLPKSEGAVQDVSALGEETGCENDSDNEFHSPKQDNDADLKSVLEEEKAPARGSKLGVSCKQVLLVIIFAMLMLDVYLVASLHLFPHVWSLFHSFINYIYARDSLKRVMPLVPLIKNVSSFFFNLIGFGFLASLAFHNNARCSWQQDSPKESVSIFNYFLGAYFSIHVITWYVVFSYLYLNVVSVALSYLLPFFSLSYRNERGLVFVIEILFGFWAAGEVLGGWCDLERIGECILDEAGTGTHCESFIIKAFTLGAQSTCEKLTSSYDEEQDAYVRNPSVCYLIFRYLGHFVMTLLSTLFTYVVL